MFGLARAGVSAGRRSITVGSSSVDARLLVSGLNNAVMSRQLLVDQRGWGTRSGSSAPSVRRNKQAQATDVHFADAFQAVGGNLCVESLKDVSSAI